jgi:hypothetical protein
MAVDSELLELFGQTVTIEPYSTQNAYAESSFGSGVSYVARTERKTRLFRRSDGSEVVAVAVTYLAEAPTISTKDRITLPDGSQPPIIAVESMPDETGDAYYTAVYTGDARSSAQGFI